MRCDALILGVGSAGRVVELDGRLRGVENLLVADASVVPTIPRARHHLTTLAVAEKLAETI